VGATFVVTLREAFEAALLLGIVYSYLDRVGARAQYHWVTLGGVLGLIASVAAGLALSFLSGPLLDLGPDLVAVAVIFFAVGLLTWHSWWMRQHARSISGDVQRRLDEARASQRLWIVGLVAFTGVFREGAETVLFLWGLMSQANVTGWNGITGGVAGVLVAAALGWAIFRGGRQLSLSRFFLATSVLLLLVAAGLLSSGIGRLIGLALLPDSEPLWDTSRLLADDSLIGSFLAGLAGYRARPTVLEVGGYLAYLLAAGWLFFGRAARGHDGLPRERAVVIVCLCVGVSEHEIRRAVAAGADTPEAIGAACGAGTDCGACTLALAELAERDRPALMAGGSR
jgi:high-affinity iron transporter